MLDRKRTTTNDISRHRMYVAGDRKLAVLAREALAPAVKSIVGLDLHKDEGLPWAAVHQSGTDVADLHG